MLELSKIYGQTVSSRDTKMYSVSCIGMNDYDCYLLSRDIKISGEW